MRTITQEELNKILDLHKKWINNEDGGKCADLSNVDLKGVNLSNVDLKGVNLSGADLKGVNLSSADLSYANLSSTILYKANLSYTDLQNIILISANLTGANLYCANLRYADLGYANLKGANLKGANLGCADLSYANITNVEYNEQTLFFALQCPEEGSFIGYKKTRNKIVKLLITEDAKRSSATTRKCRCSKAKVLSITELDGSDSGLASINSKYDSNFTYRVGEIVEVPDFDEDRWDECSTGIHFFITREEAIQYN